MAGTKVESERRRQSVQLVRAEQAMNIQTRLSSNSTQVQLSINHAAAQEYLGWEGSVLLTTRVQRTAGAVEQPLELSSLHRLSDLSERFVLGLRSRGVRSSISSRNSRFPAPHLSCPTQAAEKLLWKLNGGETCSFKRSPHGKVRDSLLFRC